MLTTIVLSFLAGVWGDNGVPHFVRGITTQDYPSALGSGPVPNLVAGWPFHAGPGAFGRSGGSRDRAPAP